MAVDAGARHTFARIYYINPMLDAAERGDYPEALRLCEKAFVVIHPYDDEGSLLIECFAYEEQIQRGD